jgi:hypothetical protein
VEISERKAEEKKRQIEQKRSNSRGNSSSSPVRAQKSSLVHVSRELPPAMPRSLSPRSYEWMPERERRGETSAIYFVRRRTHEKRTREDAEGEDRQWRPSRSTDNSGGSYCVNTLNEMYADWPRTRQYRMERKKRGALIEGPLDCARWE